MSAYTNEAQQRILKVFSLLFNDIVQGVYAKQICQALGESPSNVHRDLVNLKEAGCAIQDEHTGAWRVSPRHGQNAIKIFNAFERSQRMVDEARNRYAVIPD